MEKQNEEMSQNGFPPRRQRKKASGRVSHAMGRPSEELKSWMDSGNER